MLELNFCQCPTHSTLCNGEKDKERNALLHQMVQKWTTLYHFCPYSLVSVTIWTIYSYIFFRKCIQTKGKEQYAPQASDEQTNGTLNKGKGQSSQLFAPPPGFQEEIQS